MRKNAANISYKRKSPFEKQKLIQYLLYIMLVHQITAPLLNQKKGEARQKTSWNAQRGRKMAQF